MSAGDGIRCLLALGSNLGDRAAHLSDAVHRISGVDGFRMVAASSVYESEPWGYVPQGNFLNCVIEIRSTIPPAAMLEPLKAIEREMGRTEAPRNHPRIIDIDIAIAGSAVVRSDALTIPHPRMAQRRFVLLPLCELAPDMRHPVLGATMLELLAVCGDMGRVRRTEIRL